MERNDLVVTKVKVHVAGESDGGGGAGMVVVTHLGLMQDL